MRFREITPRLLYGWGTWSCYSLLVSTWFHPDCCLPTPDCQKANHRLGLVLSTWNNKATRSNSSISTTSMSPPIPASAAQQFILVKQIATGRQGTLFLAYLKQDTIDASCRRALWITPSPNSNRTTSARVQQLKAIQQNGSHRLARAHEHDPNNFMSWYTMDYISGYNAQSLMSVYVDYAKGFPPYLVAHILREVIQAQQHLRTGGLCYVDLQNGRNIMLHSNKSASIPKVSLIDFVGSRAYTAVEDRNILEEFMGLARTLTKGEGRVPNHFRTPRGSGQEPFEQKRLIAMNGFYAWVAGWKYLEQQTLEKLYNKWYNLLGAWMGELYDEALWEQLHERLMVPVVARKEIEDVLVESGVQLNGF